MKTNGEFFSTNKTRQLTRVEKPVQAHDGQDPAARSILDEGVVQVPRKHAWKQIKIQRFVFTLDKTARCCNKQRVSDTNAGKQQS